MYISVAFVTRKLKNYYYKLIYIFNFCVNEVRLCIYFETITWCSRYLNSTSDSFFCALCHLTGIGHRNLSVVASFSDSFLPKAAKPRRCLVLLSALFALSHRTCSIATVIKKVWPMHCNKLQLFFQLSLRFYLRRYLQNTK